MLQLLDLLANTPLPTLLVVAGVGFLVLSLITLKKPIVIELDNTQRLFARRTGIGIFIVGILLYAVPSLPSTGTATSTPDPSTTLVSPTQTSIPPTETPVPPTLTLMVLHIGFTDPNSSPPRGQAIDVPRLSELQLTTQNMIQGRYFLWMLVCKKVGQNEPEACSIKKLPLDLSNRYHDTVSIGENSEADDCAYFHLEFVIVGENGNNRFEVAKPVMPYANIPREDFADSDFKDVYRVLQNNGIDKIPCGLFS